MIIIDEFQLVMQLITVRVRVHCNGQPNKACSSYGLTNFFRLQFEERTFALQIKRDYTQFCFRIVNNNWITQEQTLDIPYDGVA